MTEVEQRSLTDYDRLFGLSTDATDTDTDTVVAVDTDAVSV